MHYNATEKEESSTRSKFGAWKKMGSFWTETFLNKIAKGSKSAVQCDWMSKSSQNLQNLFFPGKIYGLFEKNWLFLKSAKDKKFVVGCNWIRKISQNVEKVASSLEKWLGFRTKIDLLKNPPKTKSLL